MKMSETLKDLWNGNIAPCEHCGAHDPVLNELSMQIENHREALRRAMTEEQRELFRTFLDCSEDYLLRMLELAFCDGFTLGVKLMMEIQ